jgi:hypothetical protein
LFDKEQLRLPSHRQRRKITGAECHFLATIVASLLAVSWGHVAGVQVPAFVHGAHVIDRSLDGGGEIGIGDSVSVETGYGTGISRLPRGLRRHAEQAAQVSSNHDQNLAPHSSGDAFQVFGDGA